MLETLRTIAIYLLAYIVSPLVQMLLAYIISGAIFPSVCGLVIKRYKTPNRIILEFAKGVRSYEIRTSFWILRKSMSYTRLLWGLVLRSTIYFVYLALLLYSTLQSTLRAAFDVALYGWLHFIANVIMIYIMAKIVLRLWRMSKTAALEKAT